MTRAIAAIALGACAVWLALGCGAAQDKTQTKLAAISAGCAVELGEAGSPGDLATMQAGCTTALRLLDPMRPDGGAK